MPIYAVWLTTGRFETRGGVTASDHAGWGKLKTFEFGRRQPAVGTQAGQGSGASTTSLNEILITKTTDVGSEPLASVGGWDPVKKAKIVGETKDPTVMVDFTRRDGRGGETTELSIRLHNVVVERDNAAPRSGFGNASVEKFRLRYGKMTYSNMPPSSPDVSRAVEAKMRRVLSAIEGVD